MAHCMLISFGMRLMIILENTRIFTYGKKAAGAKRTIYNASRLEIKFYYFIFASEEDKRFITIFRIVAVGLSRFSVKVEGRCRGPRTNRTPFTWNSPRSFFARRNFEFHLIKAVSWYFQPKLFVLWIFKKVSLLFFPSFDWSGWSMQVWSS